MTRTPQEVLAALATAAGLTPFDAARTWRDALFDDAGALTDPGAPDRALVGALAAEMPELDAHGDSLHGRLHVDWLEQVLRVPRLPAVPDTVIAHATVDPALAPAVLPPGTLLRGGKDVSGAERRYATTDALTAHGTTVTAVRTLVPGGAPPGLPGLVAQGPPYPFSPAAGAPAPHTLRLHSPVLAFTGGDLTVRITLVDAGSLAGLAFAQWRYPRPGDEPGTATGTATGIASRSTVDVTLTDGCAVADGDPWLEAAFPADRALPTELSFTRAELKVVNRSWLVPEAAYVNDGLVDVTKEFQPFGVAARRGDALYLRCDEALGKKLSTLDVSVEVLSGGATLSSAAGGSGIPGWMGAQLTANAKVLRDELAASMKPEAKAALDKVMDLAAATVSPSVEWQRRSGGEWQTFADSGGALTGFTNASLAGGTGSEPAVLGGEVGHHVRAFLAEGDFGWSKYQADLARFATQAVAGGEPTMPPPPSPPVVSGIRLRYTTTSQTATAVEARNGWAVTTKPAGAAPFTPFTRHVSSAGHTGAVAIGLELPDAVLDSTVSVWLGVESAAPCGSSTEPAGALWQWWDGTAWRGLAVADGSRLLRESGLLRFVAPQGWAVGCPDVDAATGRWLRLVTGAPERLGILTSATPDVVPATFVSTAPDPATDPSSGTALPPGTIKGTLTPVAGVKRLTNLAGVRGRLPEDDAAYRRRASGHVRHRGRALVGWDFEEMVAVAFPEVVAVRCLPHTGPGGVTQPGGVGLVVLPDRPDDPQPRPSVSLAGRITDMLTPRSAMHSTPTVLCPLYEPVTVEAVIALRRGVAALVGLAAVRSALEGWLHPGTSRPTRWGRNLFASSLAAFLDGLPDVDAVESLAVQDQGGTVVELVEVDVCRGLYCSSGAHTLHVREQL